jgi:hypothetical protein
MNRVYFAIAASLVSFSSAQAEVFSKSYKIICPNNTVGCACSESPDSANVVAKFTMYQKVDSVSGRDELKETTNAWIEVNTGSKNCFMKKQNLRAVYWFSTNCPDEAEFKKLPFAAPNTFIKTGSIENSRLKAGKIYPTFYNVASEALHPGEKTDAIYEVGSNKLIAKISKDFHDALDLEGTGFLEDGRMLNVGERTDGVWKYVILPQGSFGLGIFGHYLFPYRVAAVDFQYLCEKLGRDDCADAAAIRKKLVGMLLYIPRLKGIKLPNGAVHDGFICAHDIGGSIKRDRIDLFVGPMGGGSPFYPQCQRPNSYSNAGVQTLVPSDWKNWKELGDGKFERIEAFEYRTVAKNKGLDFEIVNSTSCKPLWN